MENNKNSNVSNSLIIVLLIIIGRGVFAFGPDVADIMTQTGIFLLVAWAGFLIIRAGLNSK